MLPAARMRHRVVLLAPTASVGGTYGDPQQTFAAAATVWASVEPLLGRELQRMRELGGEASVRVRLRWRAEVDEKWRVQIGSAVHEIVAPPIDVYGAHVEMQLLCREYRQ